MRLSVRLVVWILLFSVFTIRCYTLISSYLSTHKSHSIEKIDEEGQGSSENQSSSSNEEITKKDGKDFFPDFKYDLDFLTSHQSIQSSQHWSIYSLVIFKEPLRDVLTPPPNRI